MSPSQLKSHVEEAGHDRFFFTKDTMRFFGDRMSNYGVRSAMVKKGDEDVPVWELYRKNPVKHGLQDSAYFCKETFKRIFSKGV